MDDEAKLITLLLVDDEEEFREATSKVLRRRGFEVVEAESGERALELLAKTPPDVVVLDLKMDGLDGIATLQKIRQSHPILPVIILTGHGGFNDVIAGLRLEIVEFLRKPVDIEQLGALLRTLLAGPRQQVLRERSVPELMVPASSYRVISSREPLTVAIGALQESLFQSFEGTCAVPGHRSVVVCDADGRFRGLIRIADVLRLAIPVFLRDSPYASFFTGMLLAHCRTLEDMRVGDLVPEQPTIGIDTPLMEAIHMMGAHHLINLPVVQDGRLLGVLRDRDLVAEIVSYMQPAKTALR